MDLFAQLDDLLQRERRAAIGADLATLEELQQEKQTLIDSLKNLGQGVPTALGVRARQNIALLRQLVKVHRALAGVDAQAGYGADGKASTRNAPGLSRGVL